MTLGGTILVLASGGLGLGVGFALVTGDGSVVGPYLVETLTYTAPVVLLGALTWLLVGLAPTWASLGWLGLALSAVVMLFGDVLRMPQWLQDLSPFEHLALVPAEPFRLVPVVVVALLAGVAAVAARQAVVHRDLH